MSSRSLALAALSLAFVGAKAQDVKVEKYTLPNGMTVILHEDRSVPVATINTWFRVGSKDEPDRRSGFAHLFEHLMFMGTKRVPNGQFDKLMEAQGGNNNASTAEDRTNYFSVGPSNLLPTLLWLDAERLEALGENIDQKKLDLQRDVVKNERRENTENTPYGKAYEAINGLMFPKGHPYSWSVIGSHEDLSAASVQDVKDFFSTFYVPNNASLVVAGDFDSAKIKPLIADLFGSLPRANDVPRRPVPAIPTLGVKRTTMVDRVPQAQTIMVWHSPKSYSPGDIDMNLAAAILGQGDNSRLYKRLVVEKKLATEVSAFQESRYLGSLFYVTATAAPGVSQDAVEQEVDRVLTEFKKGGPTKAELQQQGAKIETGILSGLQSIQRKADQLNEYEFYFGDPNSFRRVLDMYRNAKPQSVRSEAGKTLDFGNRLILRVIPQQERPEQSARDAQPPIVPAAPFAPVLPTMATLANGVKLVYWQKPELPLMTLSLQLRGGAESDEPTKPGAAALAADMLSEGAGKLDAQQFKDALDLLGANFGTGADRETTTASLNVLSRNFAPALGLFADAILRPRFEAKEWDRVQRVTVADLEQADENPGAVATKVALREFFGATSPAGRPVGGTVESVKGLSLEELKAAYRRIFQPRNATFFAAGSLPLEAVRADLDKALGGWKNEGPEAGRPEYTRPAASGLRVFVVDRPGAVQTAIRFVFPGDAYRDPNRNVLSSLGTVLGGSFTSRLNQNLREDKGYTYGAGARWIYNPSFGYATAGSNVRADVTGAALKEFLNEFRKIGTGDVSAEEAGKALSTRRTDIIQGLASIQGVVSTAMGLAANGAAFADLAKEIAAIEAVTAADLNRLAPSALPLDRAVLVLVGDRAAILPQLAGLGLPNPVVVKP